jgi:RNA polymerase sigma factor (sigma-70 family)
MADKLDQLMHHIRSLAGAESAGRFSDRQLLERFSADRDEAAFVALVQRHGAMVLNVCRRVLRNDSDSEDACQATFLVLARKAHSIRKQESLGSWLHGVAHRAATSLLRQITRRRTHEKHAATAEPAQPAADVTWREVRAILDEEIQRLPAKLKDPIVLCYLQGKPHSAGAQELGVNVTTFRGRLERARLLLQKKLTQRGVNLSGALLATVLFEKVGTAALPATLVVTTVKTAMTTLTGQSAAGVISTQVLSLAQGVINTMFVAKLKITAGAFVVLSLIGAGLGLLTQHALEARPSDAPILAVSKAKLNQAEDPKEAAGQPGQTANDQAPPAAQKLPLKKEDVLEKELRQLEGAWEMLSMDVDGKKELLPAQSKVIVTHKWKAWTGTMNGKKVEEGTFVIDPTKKPKTKDISVTLGALKGTTIPAIYEINGDELRVCLLNNPPKNPGKGRPPKFTSEPDSGYIIINYKRVADKPALAPAQNTNSKDADIAAKVPPAKAAPAQEFIRDYLRVEVRGTLAITDGIIRIDVKPFVFGGSTTWKLVIESPQSVKTAKELNGKRVTLKGELQLLDGKVGKDGKRLPRERVGLAELPGELAIVVSELRPADPQND